MNNPLNKPLKVLTWPLSSRWGRALQKCVSEPFTQRTGLSVHHIEFTSVDLPEEMIKNLRENKKPDFDVIYGNTIPLIHLAKEGLCEPLNEKEMPILNHLNSRARPAAEGLSGWPFVIVYDVRYVMMYREKAFPEGPPHSWKSMIEPKFKGRVSLYPGGKGFFPIAQVMGGGTLEEMPHNMEPCWSFLKKLRPQVKTLEFNKKMTEHVKREEIDIHCTVITNVMQWKDSGLGVSWHVPEEGISVGDDALFIPSGLSEEKKAIAKEYMAFALERETQKSWCKTLGLCPVHKGIERPDRFINDPAYPKSPDDYSNALFISNDITEKYEHSLWREKFNQIFNS